MRITSSFSPLLCHIRASCPISLILARSNNNCCTQQQLPHCTPTNQPRIQNPPSSSNASCWSSTPTQPTPHAQQQPTPPSRPTQLVLLLLAAPRIRTPRCLLLPSHVPRISLRSSSTSLVLLLSTRSSACPAPCSPVQPHLLRPTSSNTMWLLSFHTYLQLHSSSINPSMPSPMFPPLHAQPCPAAVLHCWYQAHTIALVAQPSTATPLPLELLPCLTIAVQLQPHSISEPHPPVTHNPILLASHTQQRPEAPLTSSDPTQ